MSLSAAAAATERLASTTPLRIAVGAAISNVPAASGLQRFTLETLKELLRSDADVVAFAASPAVRAALGERVRLASPGVMSQGNLRGNLLRLLWHQALLPAALRRERASVFYSTVPDGMLSPPCPQVITIHDLIPLRYPESSPRQRHYFRHIVPRIAAASSAVIAVSEATRSDIQHFYGVEAGRVHVVHQGYRSDVFRPVDAGAVQRVRETFGLGEYLLSVGETRPYKNVPRLLEAFARLDRPDLQLALVGREDRRGTDLRVLAGELGVAERVRFLGYVPDEQLAALYTGAAAFVFPSLYEGFGIPLLEAMACGCPVVTSGVASMPEVCGSAAVYIDPLETDDIARGISEVLSDPALRARMRREGIERAAGFSYRSTARRILEVVRACAT